MVALVELDLDDLFAVFGGASMGGLSRKDVVRGILSQEEKAAGTQSGAVILRLSEEDKQLCGITETPRQRLLLILDILRGLNEDLRLYTDTIDAYNHTDRHMDDLKEEFAELYKEEGFSEKDEAWFRKWILDRFDRRELFVATILELELSVPELVAEELGIDQGVGNGRAG